MSMDVAGFWVRLTALLSVFDTNKRANTGQPSDTKFRLFTRLNPHKPLFLVTTDKDTILNSTFNANWETKIYIHGYLNSGKLLAPEMELKDRFLVGGDYNIIMVDWGRKSQDLYGRVVNQVVPEVGQQLASFLQVVQNATGANWKSFHLIGCSIGAHVAGFAGKFLKSQIGRITGLDPASPRYKNLPLQKRLTRTDAEFVDVIHTDVSGMVPFGGFGLKEPIGHIDFFPNGGDRQPNCSRADLLCEHLRSYDYYMETITRGPCLMVGYICSDWTSFLEGQCTDCGPRNDFCLKFGEPAAEYKSLKDDSKSVIVYLKTGGYYPYCVYHYEVRLEVVADVVNRYSMQNSSLTLSLSSKIRLQILLVEIPPGFKTLVHSYTNVVTSLEPLDGLGEVTVSKKADFANLESLVNFVHMKPMNYASQREQIAGSKLFCPIGNTLVRKRLSILKLAACTSS